MTTPRYRLLIVTDAVAAEAASLPPIIRFLIEAASQRYVVSPRLTTPLQWLESDIDRATDRAQRRLDTLMDDFASGPRSEQRVVGDETLLSAIDDAIDEFGPDHLLVGLRAHGRDDRQERHLIEGARRRFHIPLTVFEVNEAR